MSALYAKSQETEEHGQRLGQYADMIGKELGLDQKTLDDLKLLSMLHDIGKIGIDDRILNKPAKLNEEEWEVMKKHPEIGHRIAMSTPELCHIAEYILRHHERWDGSGYPDGILNEEIPLLSRILSIADAYDAMTEDRVYRKGMSTVEAIAELKRCSGTQFDPALVELFIGML
jgi:HD-GYP domain-containing protein (c-di-GMP phosphodiesterase class II)